MTEKINCTFFMREYPSSENCEIFDLEIMHIKEEEIVQELLERAEKSGYSNVCFSANLDVEGFTIDVDTDYDITKLINAIHKTIDTFKNNKKHAKNV